MKAYEISEFGIDKLSLIERPMPELKAGQVMVRLRAASLNYRDLMVVSGTYNPRMKLPAIPLSDGSGEITALADDVKEWAVGDRVSPIFAQGWLDGGVTEEKRRTSLGAGAFWDGVLREYAAFDARSIVKFPEHLTFEEAATLPCAALTAWHALAVSGQLKAGDTVLTLGTGGVSIFAVQLAKLFGARVLSTTGHAEKAERLRSLGVSDVINYREQEDWDRVVKDLSGGAGVDHVVEVGGAGTLVRSISAVRLGGHIAMIGALTGGAGFDPISVFIKAVRMQGIFVGSRQMFEDMNKAISVAKMKPVIDRVFDFGNVGDALKYMESGEHFGKIVIRF